MANHAVNRARITIVGLVLSHKGNTAQRAMPCRNFRIGITTSRPRVYLNALEILLGLASNAPRLHRRQPLGIALGQLNCNTQVIVAVGRLSIIAKAYQSLDLVIVEINVDLKTTIRRAIWGYSG